MTEHTHDDGHTHDDEPQGGLPAEVLLGLVREELARVTNENTDLRLENRWLTQVKDALTAQITQMTTAASSELSSSSVDEAEPAEVDEADEP